MTKIEQAILPFHDKRIQVTILIFGDNGQNENEEALAFHLVKRRSRRIGPEVVTDLDFADDIALLSEEIHQAQDLLLRC